MSVTAQNLKAFSRPTFCRVYFFDVPVDTVLERLTLRRVDPVTGKRCVVCYAVDCTN